MHVSWIGLGFTVFFFGLAIWRALRYEVTKKVLTDQIVQQMQAEIDAHLAERQSSATWADGLGDDVRDRWLPPSVGQKSPPRY